MGTRALAYVHDGETLLVTIYRQSDGYPTGMGADIKSALAIRELVNGIRYDRQACINGMGCAAALLIASLKSNMDAGNIYISKPGANEGHVDYVYSLHGNTMTPEAGIRLVVKSYGKTLHDGPIAEFDPDTCEKEDAE
jgi:hypothetical protein